MLASEDATRSLPWLTATSCRPLPWQALANGAAQDVDLLDGVLGQVSEDQAETALRILAPGPDGVRRYHEAFPAAGPVHLPDPAIFDTHDPSIEHDRPCAGTVRLVPYQSLLLSSDARP